MKKNKTNTTSNTPGAYDSLNDLPKNPKKKVVGIVEHRSRPIKIYPDETARFRAKVKELIEPHKNFMQGLKAEISSGEVTTSGIDSTLLRLILIIENIEKL